MLQKAIAPPIFTKKGTMIIIRLYMIQLVKIIVELLAARLVNSVYTRRPVNIVLFMANGYTLCG